MPEADAWAQYNPVRILFGPGRLDEIGGIVNGRVLVVATEGATRRGVTGRISDLLASPPVVHDRVRSNPTIEDVGAAVDVLRASPVDWVVAVGGGSAIDVGKVLSVALANPDVTVPGLLAGDHPWQDLAPLPMVAIPTTAGTGAEVTPFATLWDGDARRKHSVGTRRMHPAVAIVDPELARSAPWPVTLSCGLDAYSQSFEAILNRNATPISSAVAEHGIDLVPDALRAVRAAPDAIGPRAALAEAALCSGLAISQTRTGLAHSMSYPITAHLGLPHGLACALALPSVVAFNAVTDDGRLARMADRLGLEGADGIVPDMLALYDELGVRDMIRRHVPGIETIRPLMAEMVTPERADNNLRPVTEADLPDLIAHIGGWFGSDRAGS